MIALIDYGAGNLRSVANLLEALGERYEVTQSPEGLRRASKLILPGVGHFGQMMRALGALKIREPLMERLRAGTPYLGICLGMHALFETSAEAPEVQGLGLFPGAVQRFPPAGRIPQMGWNRVRPVPGSRLLGPLGSEPWFYFAHSYYVPVNELTAGTTEYGISYSSAVESGNVFGVQFHPEKSALAGRNVLAAFAALGR